MKRLPIISQVLIADHNEKVKIRKDKIDQIPDNSFIIRSLISGVSHGTELSTIRGELVSFDYSWDNEKRNFDKDGKKKSFPKNLGYETVAEVILVGEGVKSVCIGDRIWADVPHSDYYLIDELKDKFYKLPSDISNKKAACLALTRVALAGVHDANPLIGEIGVVSGLGCIGLLTVQLLKLSGVKQVYGIDPKKSRRKVAEKFGAISIDPLNENPAEKIYEISNSNADFVIEASGSLKAVHEAIKCCKIGGKVVTVASYKGGADQLYLGHEWHKNRINLISSMSINNCPHRNYPLWDLNRLNLTSIELLKLLDIDSIISHEFLFKDYNKLYKLLKSGDENVIKMIITHKSLSKQKNGVR